MQKFYIFLQRLNLIIRKRHVNQKVFKLTINNSIMEEKPQPTSFEINDIVSEIYEGHQDLHQQKQEYQSFFKDASIDILTKQDLRLKLHSQGIITYHKYSDDDFFVDSAKREGNNKQILELKVNYGSFTLNVTILIAQCQSQMHFLDLFYQGQNTAIYDGTNIFPKTMVKCFSFKDDNFQHIFLSVLRQVCVSKICYCLQVSPSRNNICEFDFIIFKDCIEIYMEKCLSISQVSLKDFTEQKVLQLKTKLKRLHAFQIVHTDIKPGNICFSPSLGEFVFIDFGYSRFTGQKIGEKTLTMFMGTKGYFSEEMKKCHYDDKINLVDLQFNDVHCMKITLIEFEEIRKRKFQLNQQIYNSQGIQQPASIPFINPIYQQSIGLYADEQAAKKMIAKMAKINAKYYVKHTCFQQLFSLMENSYHAENRQFTMSRQVLNQDDRDQFRHVQQACNFQQLERTIRYMKQEEENQAYQYIGQDKLSKFIQSKAQNLQRYYRGNITKTKLMTITLNLDKSPPLRQILINTLKSKSLPLQFYLQQLVSFLNFKEPVSTYQQKIQAATVFLQIFDIEVNPNIHILRQVNQCLFTYYLQENKDSFVREIPIIYGNLIILKINMQQIIRLFTLTIRKQMSLTQFFQILVRMTINTYWLILHKESRLQLVALIQSFSDQIRINLTKIMANSPLNRRDESICNEIVYFMRIPKNFQSFDKKIIIQSCTPNVISICRFVEKQTFYKISIFYFFHYVRKLLSDQYKHIDKLANFFSLVCKIEQNTIDYYHYIFAKYYQSIGCFKQLNNLNKKLQQCLDNKDLILNNMIYWVNNPFSVSFRNQQDQWLFKNIKPDFLDSILIKFSNCSKDQYRIFSQIFLSLQPVKTLCIPQFNNKMSKVYNLSERFFPILYQQQLYEFLQQFEDKQIHLQNRQVNNFYYQINRINNYIQLMISIHHKNPLFDSVRFIQSNIDYLQKEKSKQDDQAFLQYYQQELKYHQVLLYSYQENILLYFQKIAQYFTINQFSDKIKYRKLILLKSTFKIIEKASVGTQIQVKQAMNNFISIAINQLIDKEGFIFYPLEMTTHQHYTYIIYRVIVIMKNYDEGCRIILKLFQFIYKCPTKYNLRFLVRLMVANFGNPRSMAKQIFTNIFMSKITPIVIDNNPYLIFLCIFLRLFFREQEQQIIRLSNMLKKYAQKLNYNLGSIIQEIIYYKIVSKDLQFFQPLNYKKSLKKRMRFQFYSRRSYLRKPFNQVKVYNYPKLLMKKYQNSYLLNDSNPKLKLVNKLNQYSRFVEKNETLALLNLPNPFVSNQ